VIHATGGSPALKTAVRFARHLGAHLIHTVHSWLPGDRAERLPALVRGVVVVNEDLREHLVNELNVPKGMIRVIPYGVNVPPEAPPEPEGSSRIPIVGTIGRLEKERRYHEFLEAVARAREINDNAHFMIAGEGPGEDRLRKQAKELGLTDCVTFVQPQGNHEEIYSVMDILVVLSDWGGVGLTLLEAMARECPVIATGGGELFSILGEEKICVIVPGGDVGRLADEICALLSDPQRRRELGRNARQHVLEKYPLEAEVLRVEEYYGEVVFQGTR
jgi:glycosyltransferase involved in cell wall biosynthesis